MKKQVFGMVLALAASVSPQMVNATEISHSIAKNVYNSVNLNSSNNASIQERMDHLNIPEKTQKELFVKMKQGKILDADKPHRFNVTVESNEIKQVIYPDGSVEEFGAVPTESSPTKTTLPTLRKVYTVKDSSLIVDSKNDVRLKSVQSLDELVSTGKIEVKGDGSSSTKIKEQCSTRWCTIDRKVYRWGTLTSGSFFVRYITMSGSEDMIESIWDPAVSARAGTATQKAFTISKKKEDSSSWARAYLRWDNVLTGGAGSYTNLLRFFVGNDTFSVTYSND
ncbi:hypothetical protein J2Z48_000800 [Croceifilum oryzae]|uniref:Uncharacterized protein n=1 Tax=Croceifilum oryzae TaxID=1553429 RepID=A0AAJ1WRS5_9BACL|nr:hypothetical protein [Croceifilum oryzae]MDQ0416633.1 hypothetical protein [Croceifilum oryzae]